VGQQLGTRAGQARPVLARLPTPGRVRIEPPREGAYPFSSGRVPLGGCVPSGALAGPASPPAWQRLRARHTARVTARGAARGSQGAGPETPQQ